MTHTGPSTGEIRLGERPAGGSTSGCQACGHPYALHSNGATACRAGSCTAGPGGQPCEGFVTAGQGEQPARLAS